MASAVGERAIDDALGAGNAILKFISPNDAGVTGSHQCGFYLPKAVWPMYSPHPPVRDRQDDESVEIVWQDGRVTASRIVWYGRGTRAEYRLTRFGLAFPFLTAERVGDLFVLIPRDRHHFAAYVLDLEEDIADLLAALGVEPFERWGVYRNGSALVESEGACIDRQIDGFSQPLAAFPSGDVFAGAARRILDACVRDARDLSPDAALLRALEIEFALFRAVERRVCEHDIAQPFRAVDQFLAIAATIMNRRKARAGRALENHVEHALRAAGVPHEMRPDIDGRPDVVLPSAAAYHDPTFPVDRLVVLGVKTTCKDRWRQVLNEGRRVPEKYILTTQPGISAAQLREMHAARVTLVVPERLHRDYPSDSPIALLTVASFLDRLQTLTGSIDAAAASAGRLF